MDGMMDNIASVRNCEMWVSNNLSKRIVLYTFVLTLNQTLFLTCGMLATCMDMRYWKKTFYKPWQNISAKCGCDLERQFVKVETSFTHHIAQGIGFQKVSVLKEGTFCHKALSMEVDDDIIVLYDKKQDHREGRKAKDKHPEMAVVCLEDIPLPSRDYKAVSAVSNIEQIIRLEDIPLPPDHWLCPQSNKNMKEIVQGISISSEGHPLLPSRVGGASSQEYNLASSDSDSIGLSEVEVQAGSISPEVVATKEFGSRRKWEKIGGTYFSGRADRSSGTSSSTFTVMSYNVLAQLLLESHSYLYQKHDKQALSWEYRKNILFQEINEANADVLCLQEVQQSHLEIFRSHLKSLGYSGLYKQRTNGKVDGCALFYKDDKFKLVESASVEYYQDYHPEVDLSILNRDNVAIVARLQLKELHGKEDVEQQIVVATTHLLYNPRRHDIKLAQTQILLAELERLAFMSYDNQTNTSQYWPVVITGDFNLKPDSAVYHFLTKGFLQYSDLAKRSLSPAFHGQPRQGVLVPPILQISDNCQHVGLLKSRNQANPNQETLLPPFIQIFNSDRHKSYSSFYRYLPTHIENIDRWRFGSVSHNFNLRSVYSHRRRAKNGRLQFEATTHQDDWVTVDYIFYSERDKGNTRHEPNGHLQLVARYTLPTRDQCHQLKHLPNLMCGSDHLPLIAKFVLNANLS